MLTTICSRRDYRDGLDDTGVSLFDAEPVIKLAERIAEATKLVAADSPRESYVASPNRKVEGFQAVWETHKDTSED